MSEFSFKILYEFVEEIIGLLDVGYNIIIETNSRPSTNDGSFFSTCVIEVTLSLETKTSGKVVFHS